MNLEIPKNVREALQEQVPREAHPAADLLNAYAERSLSASEEALIVGHLADCSNCREVVFLAASAAEVLSSSTEVTALAEPRRSVWWRWAMPATAMVAIAGAVLFMERPWEKEPAPAQEARVISSSSASSAKDNAAEPKHAAKASETSTSPARHDHAAATPPPLGTATNAPAHHAVFGRSGPTLAAAQPVPLQKIAGGTPQNGIGNRDSRGLPDYQGLQTSNVSLSGPSARTQNSLGPQATSITNGNSDVYGPVPPPAPASVDVDASADAVSEGKVTSKAKPAMQFNFLGSPGQRRNALSRMAIQFWRITADGHVEHFIQNSWNRTLNGVQKSFRVVAYLQNHVWAGGVGPELYHSADNGQTWNTMRVRGIDAELSGTMQSIRALNEKHVAIVADDGSLWVTTDGGKTWDKQ